MKYLLLTIPTLAFFLPEAALAIQPDAPQNLNDVITQIINILKTALPVLFGIAVVLFIIGLFQYITNDGSQEDAEEGRQRIMWGIIGIFVISCMWAIVWFVAQSFGLA